MNENQNGLILSVQRSGTRFIQRVLTQAGLKTAQLHTAPQMMERIEVDLKKCCDEGLPVVIPLRHPFSVAHSWKNRGEQLDDMFKQWELLIQTVDRCNPWFVPVDHPERQHFLDELADDTGLALETRWKKYGSKPGMAYLDPDEQELVNQLVATEFVQAFYTEDVPHGT